ncbi:NAD(P)/FAD-dependent oxidoreductase [Streptomyces marincola]|uniref:Oxidoreductase n=1 Tax=Streptomyces marincola TaxID=2878388 RepID=A0A1W7D2Q3_9ACTN|nr:FAD-dependent oxidoreductase [Streptomyces marincola]ARQ71237.1 oxidoreductase [Streptomyces marincola]
MTDERAVIVGAGLAGSWTAARLRQEGFEGRITLLGAEPHPPYDRPPLSKDVLRGAHEPGADAEATGLGLDFDALGVELLTGRAATGLRPGPRLLDTDQGPLPYDHLVLATGAEPVTLPGTQGRSDVHVLRTLDDARRLRRVLDARAALVAVGAGWIGAEVATAARAAGCRVTVVEAAGRPLAGTLPREAAEPMRRWYTEAGVELRTGHAVTAVRDGEVELADGTVVGADAVLVGIGSRPATGWLAGSGVALAPDGSVRADARLRTSAPGVWAVGDCASYPSARYGERLLVHHWDNALSGAGAAAAGVLGREAAHDPVPYFWSEQFGRRVQYAGHRGRDDVAVTRGDPGAGTDGWSVCWLRPDGTLAALLTVDRPRDLAQGRRLAERAVPLDPGRVADPSVPLKAAVR